MSIDLTRRQFGKLFAGTAAGTALLQLGRSAVSAAPVSGYKAQVGIFLFGGNDGFNMLIPNDQRYADYARLRGGIAMAQNTLVPLSGTSFALHPSMAPLQAIWDQGGLNFVMNTGTLYQPLTKAQYLSQPNLRPTNLMDHAQEQWHWQGFRARDINTEGFMGRMHDRIADSAVPSLISFGGSDVILAGAKGQSLIMPSQGVIARNTGTASSADPAVFARNSAVTALASGAGFGAVSDVTGSQIANGYTQSATANTIVGAATSAVDKYFVDDTGAALRSEIGRQLLRTARMIEARATLGHSRQSFFVSQGGYDTHADQHFNHTPLLKDLAFAMAAFFNAMKALGLSENVTAFTLSDFGRTFVGNGSGGTDHGWGNNHMIMGGAVKGKQLLGQYPSLVMSGDNDGDINGRWLPTTASEEYVGAIAKWHGVADADMSYVFPNWQTWSTNGRGPLNVFQS